MAIVTLSSFSRSHTDELLQLWRASFESGVGIAPIHTLQQQRDYLLEKIVPSFRVSVALAEGRIVGFVAASNECIDQLYVRVDCQAMGIGSRLLQWAKDGSAGHLYLYTFERNRRAQRFYEARGFEVAARGFEPGSQLAGIRYEWLRCHDV